MFTSQKILGESINIEALLQRLQSGSDVLDTGKTLGQLMMVSWMKIS